MTTRKTSTPRAASKSETFDVHAAVIAAERAIMAGEKKGETGFATLCKAAERGFYALATPAEQSDFKASLMLDIFAARMNVPAATDDERAAAESLRTSITLRERPSKKAFGDDTAGYEMALAIFNANTLARGRVSKVFGARGAKHWEMPLAENDAAREKAARGAKTDKGADKGADDAAHIPDFKGSDDDAGAWAGELMMHLARVAKANPKCKAFAAFAKGAQAALDKAYPATV